MPSNERISKEGFYGGPDVLHSHHCLNSIRKHLDVEYYAGSMTLPHENRRIHIDHCVDHLGQALLWSTLSLEIPFRVGGAVVGIRSSHDIDGI
jgi:hypothetical protein